ncbi:GDSL-type esterase/lipase family protein [Neobacillus sp. NPDC093127]|uniref:SGNH/GDSL hydrolase family protein n=1 Tax=Neobacillus sp. NPDC093127 TaxID=3364296 RepID=UPI0037F86976
MKLRRFSLLFVLMLALSTFFSSFAFAENNVKPNLVALGDSITFGWNLENNGNREPSPKAFPYLIGNGNYDVAKNISGGGWTTANLLTEINKPENLEAIKNADIITLDIGSNDFLQNDAIKALRANPSTPIDPIAFGKIIQEISGNLFKNLGAIIGTIKAQNDDAQIIIYNIYNPFSDTLAALYPLGEQFLPGVNAGFQGVAAQSNLLLADAYSSYKGKQAELILPNGDVHPNVEGQKVLASLSTNLLAAQNTGEITVDLTPSTTETTKEPVTITVATSAKKVLAMQWLAGEKTIEDFAQSGTDITDNKFEVTENGTYTVYVRDSKGAKAVEIITIDNIQNDEQPGDNPGDDGDNLTPDPGDGGTDNPAPNPGDTGNDNPTTNPGDTGSDDPSSGGGGVDKSPVETGNHLPSTATSMYNYLAIGLALILAGLLAMRIQQKRRKENF